MVVWSFVCIKTIYFAINMPITLLPIPSLTHARNKTITKGDCNNFEINHFVVK